MVTGVPTHTLGLSILKSPLKSGLTHTFCAWTVREATNEQHRTKAKINLLKVHPAFTSLSISHNRKIRTESTVFSLIQFRFPSVETDSRTFSHPARNVSRRKGVFNLRVLSKRDLLLIDKTYKLCVENSNLRPPTRIKQTNEQ